jgi:hemerythrin superfamily protein
MHHEERSRRGDRDAAPRRGPDRGGPSAHGPKNYTRSDLRIFEDVCETLVADPDIDPSRLRVTVRQGVVILDGRVRSRDDRYDAERVAEGIRGVVEVDNRLRVAPDDFYADMDPELKEGIFGLLLDDHRNVMAMFDLLTSRRGDDGDERGLEMASIARELLAHSNAELEVLYPALERIPDLARDVRNARVEHSLVEHLLGELDSIIESNPEWMARVEVLQEMVAHHVRKEEDQLLPRALRVIDPEQSRMLGDKFQRAKEQALKKHDESASSRPARSRSKGMPSPELTARSTSSSEDAGKSARK